MSDDTYEIKACPRCANKDTETLGIEKTYVGDSLQYVSVYCECGASVSGSTADEAVRLWNERPVEAYMRAEVDALRERLADLVQRLRNLERAMPQPSTGARLLTEEYLQGFTDGQATGAHNALASVPWNLLSRIADMAEEGSSFLHVEPDEVDRMINRFNDWFNANAPKEAAE